ncbi:hypothetical protein COO60DRAFT_1636468 [Scenedesmus sp. NREL 46B-D3]|nr:hypothetical protein COO60DRAFT_1636468 [Scenedesmus sp. NREL 46B-D3]
MHSSNLQARSSIAGVGSGGSSSRPRLAASRLVLLVRGALPGETLVTRLTTVKKGYAEGIKVRSLSPHHHPALPSCQHFGTCGGCSLQALQYHAQLHHKALHIGQLLQRVGKFSAEVVQGARLDPVAADAAQQYRYRNKVQLAFSSKVWVEDGSANNKRTTANGQSVAGLVAAGPLRDSTEVGAAAAAAAAAAAGVVRPGRTNDGWGLGFYLPGSNSVVMPVEECSLVAPQANQLIAAVARVCQQLQLQPHNPATGSGVLRHLIVRMRILWLAVA